MMLMMNSADYFAIKTRRNKQVRWNVLENHNGLPKRISPFFTNVRWVSQLNKNSSWSSGDFWASSEKLSPRALCVWTTLWKCEAIARAMRRILAYFLWTSLRDSILASISRSTVLDPLPNLSEINCLVVLYVFRLHSLMISILFWATRLTDFGMKSPLGLFPVLLDPELPEPYRGTLVEAATERINQLISHSITIIAQGFLHKHTSFLPQGRTCNSIFSTKG